MAAADRGKTLVLVRVNKSDSLQISIDDFGADECHAVLYKIGRNSVGPRVGGKAGFVDKRRSRLILLR